MDRKDQPAIYKGEEILFSTRTALSMVGPIQIEINHVYKGTTPHTDWIKKHGEGFHHLGVFTDDIEQATKRLAEYGIKPFFSGGVMGIKFIYFDTEALLGCTYELIQLKRKRKPKK